MAPVEQRVAAAALQPVARLARNAARATVATVAAAASRASAWPRVALAWASVVEPAAPGRVVAVAVLACLVVQRHLAPGCAPHPERRAALAPAPGAAIWARPAAPAHAMARTPSAPTTSAWRVVFPEALAAPAISATAPAAVTTILVTDRLPLVARTEAPARLAVARVAEVSASLAVRTCVTTACCARAAHATRVA